jgi:hypothetical protein
MRGGIAVLIVLIAAGCDFFDADEENKDQLASIDSIRVVSSSELSAKINLYATVSDPCWLYTRHTEYRDNLEFTYRVYIRQKENSVCPQVLTTLTFPMDLWVPAKGTYTLRFHKTDTITFDTTITF